MSTPTDLDEQSLQFALQLQKQFDDEYQAHQQEIVKQNSEKDVVEEKKDGEQKSEDTEAFLTDDEKQKKKQEELDMLVALKIQEEMYGGSYPQNTNKPSPFTYNHPLPNTWNYNQPVASDIDPPAPRWRPKKETKTAAPTQQCVNRIVSDLKEIIQSQSQDPTIHVNPDENDITHIDALIVGVEGTPYWGGFFHYDMEFPHDYPWNPPVVTIETTDGGTVRFNPNLYANGKVCLSILGTWSGPSWSEIQTIKSTLMSIQSLMNENPYHNEPGHEVGSNAVDVKNYNDCIEHETIRVAVCGMMENPTFGDLFRDVMDKIFLENFDKYIEKTDKLKDRDGKPMIDPYGAKRGNFRYGTMIPRLHKIKQQVDERHKKREEQAERERLETQKKKEEEEEEELEEVSGSDMEEEELEEEDDLPASSTTTATSTTTSTEQKHEVFPGNEEKPEEDLYSNQSDSKLPSTSDSAPVVQEAEIKDTKDESKSTTNQVTNSTTTSAVSLSDEELAKSLQAQLELDEELARKLQEEMYDDGGAGRGGGYGGYNAPYGGGFGSYYGGTGYGRGYGRGRGHALGGPPVPTVKAPTLDELKREEVKNDADPDFDPSFVCLICKQTPVEYIVPPGCAASSHIYCYSCAQAKLTKGNASRQSQGFGVYPARRPRGRGGEEKTCNFLCVLCSSVSHLDPAGGLDGLKRRKKRKRTEPNSNLCPTHNEEFSLFCLDDAILVCHLCVGSEQHRRHKCEALDVAKNLLGKEMEKDLKTLETKWSQTEDFVKAVNDRTGELEKEVENKLAKAKEELQALKKVLENKEIELENSIKRIGEQKKKRLQIELEKARNHLESIPDSLQVVQGQLEEKEPLAFLQTYEDREESIRHLCNSVAPKVKEVWFKMPNMVKTQQVGPYLQQVLQYKDHPRMYYDDSQTHPIYMTNDYDEESEDDMYLFN